MPQNSAEAKVSYTPLVGQERFRWIEGKYRKYRRRILFLSIIFASGWVILFGSGLIPVSADLRPFLNWFAIVYGIAALIGPVTQFDSVGKILPQVEDRVLYYLAPALVNLKAYVANPNKDDQNKSLKNLRKISRVLDIWDTGNLKFVKETLGETVKEFRKNFQGRVVPAIREGDNDKIKLLQIWLSQVVQNVLEMGQLTEQHLKGWSAYLTAPQDPKDPKSPDLFPYHEPKPNRLSWLRSKWFHLIFLVSLPVAPAVTYSLAVSANLASRDAAFGGAVAVFVAVIGAWVVMMTIGKQKTP